MKQMPVTLRLCIFRIYFDFLGVFASLREIDFSFFSVSSVSSVPSVARIFRPDVGTGLAQIIEQRQALYLGKHLL